MALISVETGEYIKIETIGPSNLHLLLYESKEVREVEKELQPLKEFLLHWTNEETDRLEQEFLTLLESHGLYDSALKSEEEIAAFYTNNFAVSTEEELAALFSSHPVVNEAQNTNTMLLVELAKLQLFLNRRTAEVPDTAVLFPLIATDILAYNILTDQAFTDALKGAVPQKTGLEVQIPTTSFLSTQDAYEYVKAETIIDEDTIDDL